MNYRHAYHAGNFADVMKHALLTRILVHLQHKGTPFFALDTHGGIGLYDLTGGEADRTGEWRDGIGRLATPTTPEAEALLAPYRAVLAATRARHGPAAYPGSPLIVGHFLRPQDRALAVELHPLDAAVLKAALVPIPGIRALPLDGWTALRANIPPKERRGLILIDPPYEARNELTTAVDEVVAALRKWPTGIMALWYPIKDRAVVDEAAERLARSELRKLLRLELLVEPDGPAERLNGCGLIVANPPWMLANEAKILLPALAERLGRDKPGEARCHWIAGE
ncbi:23S rRNA (adenine(2030)-N(6))-methyltransferase RlmJ [Chelatococcus reniformis]|uniref:Ribosomal RNA large subunit methyltransferase J n=1 Tax=Chelatococcus reniformis TaxID=1494448 RepID=A0A916XLI7_9HYPH|nr:23S rRNA (adenine(2030)-N(6))-methyltransferase RlmJ [Chelatococcus reniformis]GGC80262.1 ribosomal RNA large subunit methyltransferase J [Chelatococcus reniformis]